MSLAKQSNFFIKMTKKREINERTEALMRIAVLIVVGILLMIWRYLIYVLAIVNWLITIFTGKRNKDIADLSEYWNTEVYKYVRYNTFVSNKRPFPFSNVERMSKFEN